MKRYRKGGFKESAGLFTEKNSGKDEVFPIKKGWGYERLQDKHSRD